jgi:rubredoxin
VRRDLVWVKTGDFQGWACSECAWVFNPSAPPNGNTLEEMKQNYEQQRDQEFVSHVCKAHATIKRPNKK